MRYKDDLTAMRTLRPQILVGLPNCHVCKLLAGCSSKLMSLAPIGKTCKNLT